MKLMEQDGKNSQLPTNYPSGREATEASTAISNATLLKQRNYFGGSA